MKQKIAQLINWDFGVNGELKIKDKNTNENYYAETKRF